MNAAKWFGVTRVPDEVTRQIIWVVAAIALASLPHAPHLPVWVLLLLAVTAGWRVALELRGAKQVHKILKIGIAFGATAGVLSTYRTLNGVEAGTALLVVMAGVKLLETNDRRDMTVLVFIAYFLLFSAFLYSQALTRLPYLIVTAWVLTALLLRLHQNAGMSLGRAMTLTGKMLLQAAPVALLLFLFFPRLPGQFWALPARESGITGLSDEMTPGDVSDLSLSSDVAFRVKFTGALPPAGERYWRGPVLHEFDGRSWRRPKYPFFPSESIKPTGTTYDYRVTLEPHNRRWIFALDTPTQWPTERGILTFDRQLLSLQPISSLTSFQLQSSTGFVNANPLSASLRLTDKRLPTGTNPRTQALAYTLRQQAQSDRDYIQTVLARFRTEEFYYTFTPPRLGRDPVDEFLFETRRGFCEHYASAFTLLMRAAGIPARVVTGYQGGEYNPMGGYLIVRQSDAHAWSEVWLEGQGWVRFDPTAAVAPERIEKGSDVTINVDESTPGRLLRQSAWLAKARLAWDAVNTAWNDSVVEFNAAKQRSLLEQLGIEEANWRTFGVALVLALGAFFAALTLYLAWQFRPRTRDPAVRAYARLCHKLGSAGIERLPHEGPVDYLTRAARERPAMAPELEKLRSLYVGLRYGPAPTESDLEQLEQLVGKLKVH
jgi:transglutaminase-like putative cysteine protease